MESYLDNRICMVLNSQALGDISKWLKVAFDKGLDKVASFIYGVSLWHIHHKWFNY